MIAMDKSQRFLQARRTTWIGLIINLLLVIFKTIAGILGQSAALIADTVHSASDFITDLLVLIGLKISERPMDETHPYGHGRVETIATFLLGLVLGIVGLGIGYKAVISMIKGVSYTPKFIALIAALTSIAVKEGIYQYTIKVSQKTNFPTLRANAWHHRSDAFSSVATFLGVGGAMLNPDWLILDPLVACVVAIFIVKVSAEITWGAFLDLADTSVKREVREQIEQVAKAVPGVIGLHKLKTRHVGSEIFIDVHIEVNPGISVTDGHRIATQMQNNILRQIDSTAEVNIHVEPEGINQDQAKATLSESTLEKRILQLAASIDGIRELPELKITVTGTNISVAATIAVDPRLTVADTRKLAKNLQQKLADIKPINQIMLNLNLLED